MGHMLNVGGARQLKTSIAEAASDMDIDCSVGEDKSVF
jgi:hypothetical protein